MKTDFESVFDAALEAFLDRHDPMRRAERAMARKQKTAHKTKRMTKQTAEQMAEPANKLCTVRVSLDNQPSTAEHDANPKTLVRALPQQPLRQSLKLPLQKSSKRVLRLRKKLKATCHHEVIARDGNRCTFVNERGERCAETRWLHLHHLKPVSQGGSDDSSNIVSLCSTHHALIHQLSLAIDGQITWLRSPSMAYLT
jgi:predicted restriction endonuclease